MTKCGALRNLIPFVQFKKREKHPWRSVKIKIVKMVPNRPTHHKPLRLHSHGRDKIKFIELCLFLHLKLHFIDRPGCSK